MDTEFELIRRYFADSKRQFATDAVRVGIGDDGAVLEIPPDQLLCVSTDVLVGNVHFPESSPPELIARRALAVNLSDMAAMGARPLCFTLGLVIPESNEKWLHSFSEGLLAMAQEYECPLVGGDTASGSLSLAIQIQGLVEHEKIIRRQGARPGDRIYVSGFPGDGALALLALGQDSHLGDGFCLSETDLPLQCQDYFRSAFFQPQPRIELACGCAHLVSSGIDISDGLHGDLAHILRASNAGANLEIDSLPFSECAKQSASETNRVLAALFGGDDYELCVTVPRDNCEEFEHIAKNLQTTVNCIGEITAEPGLRCLDKAGHQLELKHASYSHFMDGVPT